MRLIIVSNRLPVVLEQSDGCWQARLASGGLVSALAPVLRKHGGLWIGWSGALEEDCLDEEGLLQSEAQRGQWGYGCKPIRLTRAERDQFYYGFANQIVWPLFHSLDARCNFEPAFWEAFQHVNRKFADVTAAEAHDAELIWIHDYQLMLVGGHLRELGIDAKLGFFLHIPFPPLDIFLKLPWRFEVLRGLLAYDMVGFQTVRDRRNFVQCVRTLLKDAAVSGRGRVQTVRTPQASTRVGTFPISVDYQALVHEATQPEVSAGVARLKSELSDRFVFLGLDRLDYTKGVPNRLRAFREALRLYPQLHRKATLIQVLVPSRKEISTYQALKEEIDELVGEINGAFGEPGWMPVQYLYRHLNKAELLAYYRVASAALVTPLNDGMNLVAKEYCACNLGNQGVLVLSEFAGAAAELQRGALLVNPYDIRGMTDAIYHAFAMPADERRSRMKRLRSIIQKRNLSWWANSFLECCSGRSWEQHLPAVDLYVPQDLKRRQPAPGPREAAVPAVPERSAPLPSFVG